MSKRITLSDREQNFESNGIKKLILAKNASYDSCKLSRRYRHDVTRVDNTGLTGVDNSAPRCRGGLCRGGQIRTMWQGWTMREKKTCPSKLNVKVKSVTV